MRYILAILKESYWSAAASKLLYIELVAVVIVLLLLAPFGVTERVNFELRGRDIDRPQILAQQWSASEGGEGRMASLWSHLSESQRKEVAELKDAKPVDRTRGPRRGQTSPSSKLAAVLNQLIQEEPLEDDEIWNERLDNEEARLLHERKSSLTTENRKRLRRLLVQETFRGQLMRPSSSDLTFHYAWYTIGTVVGFSQFDLEKQVRVSTPFVLDKFFLTIGVLLAVLVTAGLIPQLLEEGNLYLLLSKPLTRTTLLLTKYVGSGMLIFVISGAFLSGIWLILGLRFGIWIQEILWMIPLALAIYLIYFSVTVTAGLLFRNTIISVLVTLGFASLCYALSLSHWGYDGLLSNDRRIKIQKLGDQIAATDVRGKLHVLDSQDQWDWVFFSPKKGMSEAEKEMNKAVFSFMPQPKMATPLPDSQRKMIVGEMAQFPLENGNNGFLTYFGAARLDRPEQLKEPYRLGLVPMGTVGFAWDHQGRLLAVSQHGTLWGINDVGRKLLEDVQAGTYAPMAAKEVVDDGEANEVNEGLDWELLGIVSETGPESSERFVYDSATDTFWTLCRNGIYKANRNSGGQFEITRSFQNPWDWSQANRVPMIKVGDQLVVPLRNGPIVVLSAEDLKPIAEYQLPIKNIPVNATHNDRYVAIAYRQDGVWYYDSQDSKVRKVTAIDDLVTAVDLDDEGHLMLVQGVDRVTTVDLPGNRVIRTQQPTRSIIRLVYDLGVDPLYRLLPKPNECYALVQHLATQGVDLNGEEDREMPFQSDQDTQSIQTTSPWNPLISSLAFAAVVMTFNVIYLSRQQF